MPKSPLHHYLPCWKWLKHYDQKSAQSDLVAALIVTALLIPQGMAYAMLAGLPPVMGLYASILPMIVYAVFGGSPTLAIGPVAIISMMTATALEPIFTPGTQVYIQGAWLLSIMSGLMLFVFGTLRLGFIIHLISHPVIKSFIIASACLIVLSQFKIILDIPLKTTNVVTFVESFIQQISNLNLMSLLMTFIFILLLQYFPNLIKKYLGYLNCKAHTVDLIVKTTPLLVMILSIFLVKAFDLHMYGIKTLGEIPSGLPSLTLPDFNHHLIWLFLPSAAMIALISFVEGISIAQATALKSKNELKPNQELVALGMSNLASGLSNGLPVTGSLSRTVVNADAGAKTPLAGVLSSIGIIAISLFLTGAFKDLPLTVLAATIVVSIKKLIEVKVFYDTWKYSRSDAIAMVLTFLGVLFMSIESGLIIGIISAAFLLLWRMSRPHIATVGLLNGTQHFRNIERFPEAIISDAVLSIRIDESLTFLNAHTLRHYIINEISNHPNVQHVILICSSINRIDASGLEMLEELHDDLSEINIQLHFSEIKGFLIDRLKDTPFFIHHFKGTIYLTHYQAFTQLNEKSVK